MHIFCFPKNLFRHFINRFFSDKALENAKNPKMLIRNRFLGFPNCLSFLMNCLTGKESALNSLEQHSFLFGRIQSAKLETSHPVISPLL